MPFSKNHLTELNTEEVSNLIFQLDHCKKLITEDLASALKMYAKVKNDPELTGISKQIVEKTHAEVINSEGFEIFMNITIPTSRYRSSSSKSNEEETEETLVIDLEKKWEQIIEGVDNVAEKTIFKKKAVLVSLQNNEALFEVDVDYIEFFKAKKATITEAVQKIMGGKKFRVRFTDVEEVFSIFLGDHKKINILDPESGITTRFRSPSFPWLSKGREFNLRTKLLKSQKKRVPTFLSNKNIEILMGDDSYSIHFAEKSKLKDIDNVAFLSYQDSLALENLLNHKDKRNILIAFLLSKLSIEFKLKISSVKDLKKDQDQRTSFTELSDEKQLEIDEYLADQIKEIFEDAKKESEDLMPKNLSFDNELWSSLLLKCDEIRFSIRNLHNENQKNIELFESDKNIELMEEVFTFLEKEGFDPHGNIPTIAQLGDTKGGGGFGLVRKIALEAKGLKQFRNDYRDWLKTKKTIESNANQNDNNLIKLDEEKLFTTASLLNQIPLEPCSKSENLMANWDFERNFNIHPFTTSKFSNKVAFFKCKRGHTWSTRINHYKGCPSCAPFKKLRIEKDNQS